MSFSRWPRSPPHGKCLGDSAPHHDTAAAASTSIGQPSNSNPRQNCVQRPKEKMARSTHWIAVRAACVVAYQLRPYTAASVLQRRPEKCEYLCQVGIKLGILNPNEPATEQIHRLH